MEEDYTPANDERAEQELIGLLFVTENRKLIRYVIQRFTRYYFHHQDTRLIFQAIHHLHRLGGFRTERTDRERIATVMEYCNLQEQCFHLDWVRACVVQVRSPLISPHVNVIARVVECHIERLLYYGSQDVFTGGKVGGIAAMMRLADMVGAVQQVYGQHAEVMKRAKSKMVDLPQYMNDVLQLKPSDVS